MIITKLFGRNVHLIKPSYTRVSFALSAPRAGDLVVDGDFYSDLFMDYANGGNWNSIRDWMRGHGNIRDGFTPCLLTILCWDYEKHCVDKDILAMILEKCGLAGQLVNA